MSPRVPRRFLPFVLSAVLPLLAIPYSIAQTPTPSPTPPARAADGRPLTPEDLIGIFAQHRKWAMSKGKQGKEADLKQFSLRGIKLKPFISAAIKPGETLSYDEELSNLDLRAANLFEWNLGQVGLAGGRFERARLVSTNAHETDFKNAHFNDARIDFGDFSKANFHNANLSGALCVEVDFTEARFFKAILHNTRIVECRLKDASLADADLSGAIYEAKLNSLPNIPSLATAFGLSNLRFVTSEAALVELRGALRDAGLRQKEREVNYSIQRQRWRNAMQSHKMIESWFQYVFFDLTCKYGMDPGLPLRILGAAIFLFAGPYFVAIVFRRRAGQSGIWVVRNKETVHKPERRTRALAVGIEPWAGLTWRGKLLSLFRASRVAFFFSLLSAFSIGFREINVRSWIARLQPREYTLRGTGWVRALAGFQSLLSVYLLALWVLTYFGRPFE